MEVTIEPSIKRDVKMLNATASEILSRHGTPNSRLIYARSELTPHNKVPKLCLTESRKGVVHHVSKIFGKRGELSREIAIPIDVLREMGEMFGEGSVELMLARQSTLDEYTREARKKALEYANPKPGETVLEFGSGGGQFVEEALQNGATVFAIDRSNKSALTLREKFKRAITAKKLNVIQREFLDLPNESSWRYGQMDHVVSLFSTEKHPSPLALFKLMHAALKKGGRLTIVESTPFYTELVAHIKHAGFEVDKVHVGQAAEINHPLLGRSVTYYSAITARKR